MNSKPSTLCMGSLILAGYVGTASAQMVCDGHLLLPRVQGQPQMYACTAALAFATAAGSQCQSLGARTWETDPSGWFHLTGTAGNYTMVLAGPGKMIRPTVMTNQYLAHGDKIHQNIIPTSNYAVLWEGAWDNKAATDYYQTFVAKCRSVTNVGFRIVHDGVDGEGPQAVNMLLSVHRVTDGEPEKWPQVGPTVPVLGVSGGGSLNIEWATGWNSGEVPLEVGQKYAVHLRTENAGGAFQVFWQEDTYKDSDCYRIGKDGSRGYAQHDMWMYIAGDGDGLLVPYNKRVQKEFAPLTKFGRKWSQTYVAQGRGLAGVMWYAAVATSQPPLMLQQATVRVRRGGPDGPVVGIEKIACGQGTAGAGSGLYGVAVAPGEVPLQPGETYAIEMEAFGPQKGFNPVMKQPRDPYEPGTAWFDGKQKMDYDLDMLIVEYEHDVKNWTEAVERKNLLVNGAMEKGDYNVDKQDGGGPEAWTKFTIDKGTSHWYITEDADHHGRVARVIGGAINGRTVDGGYYQRVGKLSRVETYRLTGQVRCSRAVGESTQVMIGYDPTGQTDDPKAATIQWALLPGVHGVFENYTSPPIRPKGDTISVWLRGRLTNAAYLFEADFDNFELHKVRTTPPMADKN